jgi:hypothetical protein
VSEDDLKMQMSAEAVARWQLVCDCIRQALADAQLSDEGIRFVQVDGDGTPGDPGCGFMKLPAAAAARFTRPWVDRFLWPRIEERIENPGRALVDWIVDPGNRG